MLCTSQSACPANCLECEQDGGVVQCVTCEAAYAVSGTGCARELIYHQCITNISIQWSLYFKTTHGTKKRWSYIAGGLKIKVI